MQQEQGDNLTEAEKATIDHLLLAEMVPVEDSTPAPTAPKKTTAELLAAKRASRNSGSEQKSKYIPELKRCVGPSAAEVERLWSMANKVLTKERSSMSPLLFEMIMYFKYNKDLWSLADVVEANKRRKNESTSKKARKEAHCHRVARATAEIEAWDEGQGVVHKHVVSV